MQYRLNDNSQNKPLNILESILNNRGITDAKHYLNLSEDDIIPYNKLNNISEAVKTFMEYFNKKEKIGILVDSDPDGYCSAAMMYLYIKQMDKEYPVDYILHEKTKAHGLSDDIIFPDDLKLLIIPDASTNDTDECKALKDNGIEIIILDHHEKEKENPYAVIVNNQISDNYSNKSFCGAGIVYHFLQALDEENWNEYADDYLDLCALANISDVMDMRSYETKYITGIGLMNIQNKCFQALIKAQDYSMNGKINIHNIQWYITPILNSIIRIGSLEEKELLFKAFIEQDEYFEYKKRATKGKPSETIQESIYDRAARLCKNAKSRQDKKKDKGTKEIIERIGNLSDEDKVVLIDSSGLLENGLTGVVAIKVAELLNRPCILLNKRIERKGSKIIYDNKTNRLSQIGGKEAIVYGGSARNTDHSPIESFKDIVNSTKIFSGVGHPNAFGCVDLSIDDKDKALESLNAILRDIEYDSTYIVDYILDINEVDISLVQELSQFEDIIGQGINEPIIAIENIDLCRSDFEIFGKNEDTISFMIDDIKYIQFKCKSGNKLYDWIQNAWDEKDNIKFNIVGKPTINEYNGIRTPQVIIDDIEVINLNNYNEDDEW